MIHLPIVAPSWGMGRDDTQLCWAASAVLPPGKYAPPCDQPATHANGLCDLHHDKIIVGSKPA